MQRMSLATTGWSSRTRVVPSLGIASLSLTLACSAARSPSIDERPLTIAVAPPTQNLELSACFTDEALDDTHRTIVIRLTSTCNVEPPIVVSVIHDKTKDLLLRESFQKALLAKRVRAKDAPPDEIKIKTAMQPPLHLPLDVSVEVTAKCDRGDRVSDQAKCVLR